MSSQPDALLADDDELTGEVIRVIYADAGSGFGVVDLDADGQRDDPRCAGPLSDLVEGQTVRLVGRWKDHPRYGDTFEATFYEQVVPQTVAGLRNFLLSERFEHLDQRDLERVLATFGKASGTVISASADRLVDEAGLERDVAEDLHRTWRAGEAMGSLVRIAEPAGLPYEVIRAVHARFGPEAPRIATEEPYRFLDVDRCRFAHADALARHVGIPADDPRRLAAGARAAVAAARRNDGHQFVPREQCVAAAAQLLRVDAMLASQGLEAALAAGSLVTDTLDTPGGEVVGITTPGGLATERALADDLRRLLEAPHPRLRAHAEVVDPSAELTDGQAAAVHQVFAAPVSVLTGGPGTGKTRTIEEVVVAAERAELNVALCAPTGRAAKRIEELVRRPATTIHRLLEARPLSAGGFAFNYGASERLPHDLVICDEVSMCDTRLAAALVAAVDDGAHLLLVGDPDQLPSVGPGDVLRDLIRCGAIPSTELREVHRQAAGSRIVSLAREVNAGEVGILRGNDGDVFMAEDRRSNLAARTVEAVAGRIPDYFGVGVADIQVVVPIYRGPAGVHALNDALKARLNPADGRREVSGFHVADRVMQTRNDAELDVSNGDIGTVVDTDPRQGTVRVAFPRGEVTYDRSQARELTAAWAITVHKSQGGEWPVVVLVCDASHRAMLWRNLAYTAITRAQRALIVVGQADALRRAARHDRPSNRFTGLAGRLRATPSPAQSPTPSPAQSPTPEEPA